MATSPELASLQSARAALCALPAGSDAPMRAALRAVDRAADDAEAAADEARGGARAELLRAVEEARAATVAVRAAAKGKAREDVRNGKRVQLFEGRDEKEGGADEASKVAEDITAGLRRVTGIVQEELDRTQATGDIVDDSSRRLKQRRIGNSNTVTFLVKPAFRTATMPFRVLMAIVRSVTGGGRSKRSAMTTPKPSFAPVPGVGSPPSARKPPDEFPSGAVDDIAIPEDENAKAGMEDL